MAGEELGTAFANGLQGPDWQRYQQWLQSQGGPQPQQPNAYPVQQPAQTSAFGGPNLTGRVPLDRYFWTPSRPDDPAAP